MKLEEKIMDVLNTKADNFEKRSAILKVIEEDTNEHQRNYWSQHREERLAYQKKYRYQKNVMPHLSQQGDQFICRYCGNKYKSRKGAMIHVNRKHIKSKL